MAFASLALASRLEAHDESSGLPRSIARISLDALGIEANQSSGIPKVSPNGRFVVFRSHAQLVPADANVLADTYLKDLATGDVELISATPTGTAGNGHALWSHDVSDDGRHVIFVSLATDLVPVPPANSAMLFLRDRAAGLTTLVSRYPSGQAAVAWGAGLTPDARFAVFSTADALVPADTSPWGDVYLRDLQTQAIELISANAAGVVGNADSASEWITDDGRYCAFSSKAWNLVPGDTWAGGFEDTFRRDRTTGQVEIVSLASAGVHADSHVWCFGISSDGRWIGMRSAASNLVPGDTNALEDVFVRDMLTGRTERVSVSTLGAQGNGPSYGESLSPDGRFVSFMSSASNLVPNDTNGQFDILLHDRFASSLRRISVDAAGNEASGLSESSSLAEGARVVAFDSLAGNLVPNDTNGRYDVFVVQSPVPVRYCTAKTNSLGCVPAIGSTGIPAASRPVGFVVGARDVLNQVSGTLIYSPGLAAAQPFQGGTLCMTGPIRRTPVQGSGGSTSGSDCTGTFAFDLNAWMTSGADPALQAGQLVRAQFWSRDGGSPPPWPTSLTDALSFEIWP